MRIKGKGKSILTRQRLPVLGSLFTGLLDEVSGAAAAYSIRLLRADYSGGLVRVRAFDGSSDQGEADVLPDGNNEISLNSELTNRDSTAGSSGRDVDTLGELVTNPNGTDYDGFVSEWKDQTPNARHATNSTASEQPQIVSAGSLIEKNNKPTLDFQNGIKRLFNTSTNINANSQVLLVAVSTRLGDGDISFNRVFYFQDSADNNSFIIYYDEDNGDDQRVFKRAGGGVLLSNFTTKTALDTQLIHTGYYDGSKLAYNENGSQLINISNSKDFSNNFSIIALGGLEPNANQTDHFNGLIQEAVGFNSFTSQDITIIEQNVNNFFNAY